MGLYNLFVGDERYAGRDNDSFAMVLRNPADSILVAEDAGQLVGFATCNVRRVVRYPKPIASLDELFVLPAYRKRGVGRQLMAEVERLAQTAGCQRVFIESHYKHTGAHTFYETLGYTNYGYHFIKDL